MSLFKKREKSIQVVDKIVITADSKWPAIVKELGDSDAIIIFWFDESLKIAESFLTTNVSTRFTLLTAREAASHHLSGRRVVFAEHYPLKQKEEELFRKLNLDEVIVFSSLDEPLLKAFGGERISELVQKLGFGRDEVISHSMISKSIANAQEKLEKKIIVDQSTQSAAEWFKNNLEAGNSLQI